MTRVPHLYSSILSTCQHVALLAGVEYIARFRGQRQTLEDSRKMAISTYQRQMNGIALLPIL